MKKIFRSTFGTLVVAAFLAITPPMYARGGHGGGHRGHGGGHSGHAAKHAAAGHMKGGHAGVRVRGSRGHGHAVFARGNAVRAGRAYYATRGGGWGGGSWYPYSGYSGFGYYGGYGYPYGGYYGYRSGWCYDPYYGYRPCGSYPYRYGYSPYLGFSFGGY